MSILDRKKRNEVISLRLNEERVEILERYRQALTEQLHRPVSLSEAAFLVIEERAEDIDRETLRSQLLKNPTESLWKIRRKWETEHTLSIVEWDVLAVYIQIGSEEQRQEPPLLRPAVPSRESYLGLLEALEAVYRNRREQFSRHVWYYFANLGGHDREAELSEEDEQQRDKALLDLIALRKNELQSEVGWKYPGSIGRCLVNAIYEEVIDSRRINQVLAPHWPVLWRMAARGHWLRSQLPVRMVAPEPSDPRERRKFPPPIEARGLALSFADGGGGDVAFRIEFRAPRNFSYSIPRYPALVEFRAMLEEMGDLRGWKGRHFLAVVSDNEGTTEAKYTLWPKQENLQIDCNEKEWLRLRDLFRQAWEKPEIVERMAALQLEYGEQG
jgi:hypothetical protein